MTNSLDPDLEHLDELGIRAVAQGLNLSSEAVRKWRVRGAIPDNRRDELRRLVPNQCQKVGNLPSSGCQPDETTKESLCVACRRASSVERARWSALSSRFRGSVALWRFPVWVVRRGLREGPQGHGDWGWSRQ